MWINRLLKLQGTVAKETGRKLSGLDQNSSKKLDLNKPKAKSSFMNYIIELYRATKHLSEDLLHRLIIASFMKKILISHAIVMPALQLHRHQHHKSSIHEGKKPSNCRVWEVIFALKAAEMNTLPRFMRKENHSHVGNVLITCCQFMKVRSHSNAVFVILFYLQYQKYFKSEYLCHKFGEINLLVEQEQAIIIYNWKSESSRYIKKF